MRQSYFLLIVAATAFLLGFPFDFHSDYAVQGIIMPSGGVVGRPQNCTIENASWPVPVNINPNCYRCFCKEGVVRCEGTPKCENLGYCPVVVYNQSKNACCPRKCKSCHYLGQEYANDEQWLSSQDTCRMLTCKGGVITMGRMECVTLCRNPETVTGYCCPLCPRAVVKNISTASVADREFMQDPCVQCLCSERWCHCFKTACPALDCAIDNQYTPPGRCCPECRKSRSEAPSLGGRCTFQGVLYKNEHSFRPDECTLCKCQDGTVICRRFVCPIVDCPKQRIQYEPGLCCPRCRDTDPLPCEDKGVQYQHGDQWSPDLCMRCKCSNGAVRCDSIKCTELHCPRGYRPTAVVGKCCPECEETDGTCTVFGDPHYQTFDGRSFNFQGTCRYVLTKVCDEHAPKELTAFAVVVQNEPRGNDQYAWTRHVSVRLSKGVRITLLPGKNVRLNRKKLKIPHVEIEKAIFSVTFDRQKNVLLRIGKDLKIVWDGNSYVEVTLSRKYKGRVCGLCGNYNNESMDDLERSDGGGPTSAYTFGQSWRAGPWKECKSARDRQYHEKLEREKRRERHKQRQLDKQVGGANYAYDPPAAFWSIRGDTDQLLSQSDMKNGPFILLDRVRIKMAKNGRLEELLKLWSPSNIAKGQELVRQPRKEDNAVENTVAGKLDDRPARPQRQRKRHHSRNPCAGGSAKWRTRREAIEHCRLLKSPLFAACHAAVPVQRYFRSCIMDTCACPPTGRCYCEALLAYAMKCERENIFIDWRSHSSCVNADSKCAIQGAVFSPCAPICVRTCSMVNRNTTDGPIAVSCSTIGQCAPGCYCPDGTAQLLNQCVPIHLCPQTSGSNRNDSPSV